MNHKFNLLTLAAFIILAGISSCASTEQGNPNVVSHDAERADRLDSLSTVTADSVKIQGSFGNAPEKPAAKRDK